MHDYLGCDLVTTNLLTDSEQEIYSGHAVEEEQRVYTHRRRRLQKWGTRAARRKLRQISGRQGRYPRDTNHGIAKRVVAKAQRLCCGIALEDLRGIRDRIKARRRQRPQLYNWAFGQLRQFIVYKAARAGVPVVFVDPANTSRTCPARSRGQAEPPLAVGIPVSSVRARWAGRRHRGLEHSGLGARRCADGRVRKDSDKSLPCVKGIIAGEVKFVAAHPSNT